MPNIDRENYVPEYALGQGLKTLRIQSPSSLDIPGILVLLSKAFRLPLRNAVRRTLNGEPIAS